MLCGGVVGTRIALKVWQAYNSGTRAGNKWLALLFGKCRVAEHLNILTGLRTRPRCMCFLRLSKFVKADGSIVGRRDFVQLWSSHRTTIRQVVFRGTDVNDKGISCRVSMCVGETDTIGYE
jgi:hypothetical protein